LYLKQIGQPTVHPNQGGTWRNVTDYLLPDSKYPSAITMQRLVQRGYAFMDQEHGIQFDSTWDFDAVQDKLRELLPDVFHELDAIIEERNFDPEQSNHEFKAKWMLLGKEGRKAVIVPGIPYPSGADLQRFCRSTQRISFKDCVILLSAFSPSAIPLLAVLNHVKYSYPLQYHT
jgi:hypothetical protein